MDDYSGPERRKFVRVPFIFPVKYQLCSDAEGTVYHALSDNLSEGGIKIICMQKIQHGSEVIIDFSLPTSEGIFDIRTKGVVVWYQESMNRNFCGVQFSDLPEKDRSVLYHFIKKVLDFRGIDY